MRKLLKLVVVVLLVLSLSISSITPVLAKTPYSQLPEMYWDAQLLSGQPRLDMFEKMVQQYPAILEGYLGKANTLFGMQRYEESIEVYKKAIEIDASAIEAYSEMAICYNRLQKFEDAIEISDKAIAAFPDEYIVYVRKAESLSRLNKKEEEVECYKLAIEKLPKNEGGVEPIFNNIGVAFITLQRYTLALEYFQKGADYIKQNAKSDLSWYNNMLKNMAYIYDGNLKEYQKAGDLFDICIKNNPKDHNALIGRAMALCHLKQYDLAIEDANKAISLSPDTAYYYLNRALIFEYANDYKNMIADLNKYISFPMQAYDKQMQLLRIVEAYKNLNDFESALKTYDIVLSYKTYITTDILKSKFKLLISMKKYSDALLCINSVISQESNEISNYESKIDTLYLLKQNKDTIPVYNQILKLDPKNKKALNGLGVEYLSKKNIKEALAIYQRLLALNSKDADVNYRIAKCYVLLKNNSKSLEYIVKTIKLDKKYIDIIKKDKDFTVLNKNKQFINLLK